MDGIVIGAREDNTAPVAVDPELNTLVIGKPGTGKSTILSRAFLDIVTAGHGGCVLDLHGELVNDILASIPRHRQDDVIYFHPQGKSVLSFSPFEGLSESVKIAATKQIIKDIWPDGWGPLMEQQIHNILASVNQAEKYPTLLHAAKFILERGYGAKVSGRITDPGTRATRDYLDQIPERNRMDKESSSINKLEAFLRDPVLRPLMWSRSVLNLRQAMDNRQIVLIDLASGAIGENNAVFLGGIILNKIIQAFQSRQGSDRSGWHPFYVFADEFFAFVNSVSIDALMVQTRKFGGRAWIATQLLPDKMRDTREVGRLLLAGCASIVAFQLSAEDAKRISAEFAGEVTEQKLVGLNRREFHLKTTHVLQTASGEKHVTSMPQVLYRTVMPYPRDPETAEAVKTKSFAKWGTPREKVAREVDAFLSMRYSPPEIHKTRKSRRKSEIAGAQNGGEIPKPVPIESKEDCNGRTEGNETDNGPSA